MTWDILVEIIGHTKEDSIQDVGLFLLAKKDQNIVNSILA